VREARRLHRAPGSENPNLTGPLVKPKQTLLTLSVSLLVGACVPGATPSVAPLPEISHEDLIRQVEEAPEKRGMYVVIDLAENELRFMDGAREVWSAPVGTGTGLHLRGEGMEWEFSTPDGIFQVQHKELDPVWNLPDWHYVKHDLPLPPRGSPERRVPGALGVAAVYLNEEIAIHGTDKPDLLGQRVSHGCIRLENKYALRLFHNVQRGTPVVITGGEKVPPPDTAAVPTDPGVPDVGPDRSPRLSTSALLRTLDRQLDEAGTSMAWTETASELISRGIRDDAIALRGVLTRAGRTDDPAIEAEFATFAADAFARGSWRAVVSLARIPEEARERGAWAIVQGTMDLYGGSLDEVTAPWPSRRLLASTLGPEGRQGWEALRAAEIEYRERYGAARIVWTEAPRR